MDLLGKMGDEGTRRHRHGIGRIELVARANPPRALEHSDEAVVWVKVRTAEVVACEPFVDNDIKAGSGSPTSTALRFPPVPFHSI
jgi:hypothetical protein